MAGHTALLCGWPRIAAAPQADQYGTVVLYNTSDGSERFRLRGDACGIVPNSNASNVIGALPPGWAYGRRPNGTTNFPVGVIGTPWKLNGVSADFSSVRLTVAFRMECSTQLVNPANDNHVVVAARHKGTQYVQWKDNRSDAVLIGSIYGRGSLMTIEGIEGGASDNVWPLTQAQEFRQVLYGSAEGVVLESLQYGSSDPRARIRYINARNGVVYDSGISPNTGSAFTASHASIIVSCVDMLGSAPTAQWMDIFKMVYFMTPRDTEVPLSVIRAAIEV